MEFRVLGPLEVLAGGSTLPLGGYRQRAVLAALVLRANEVVSTDAIIDAAWGDQPPSSVKGLVRTYVSRLRQLITAADDGGASGVRLENRSPGYVLNVAPEQIDARRFERLVDRAREELDAGHLTAASATLGEALGLWRDEMLGDLATAPFFQPVVARYEQMRLTALEDRLDVQLGLGRHTDVVGELEGLATRYPYHERFWGQLMVAHYRSGRQADALTAYQTLRSTLADHLGLAPSPEVQALEREILDQAAELTWRAPVSHEGVDETRRAVAAEVRLPLPAALAEGVYDRPFVGRGHERTRLTRSLEAAHAGRFSAVLVAGPPGIGKTALVATFARQAHADGATVILGRADEDAAVPFLAIREAVRDWLSSAPASDVAQLGDEDAGHLARIVPALGERLGVDPPVSAAGDDAVRHVLFEAITRWVGVLAADRPAVIVLDDLQWADQATLLSVQHLLRHPPAAGVLLLAALRDTEARGNGEVSDLLATTRGAGHVHRIDLSGLTDEDVVALLAAEAGGDNVGASGEAFAAQLNAATGGNPLFIHETLRHLVERGVLAPESAPPWSDGQPLEAFGVSSGVTEVIDQRLKRLPETTTAILRQASVLGRHVDMPVLSKVADINEVAVLEALEPAMNAMLVEEVGTRSDQVAFSHSVVREAILDGLPASQRARLHWYTGRAIATVRASDPVPHLGEIAYHLAAGVGAGDPEAAISANVEAGEQAMAELAFEDASARFATAKDLLEKAGAVDADLAYRTWQGVGQTGNVLVDRKSRREGYQRAAAIAREQQWPQRLARAAIGFGSFFSATGRQERETSGDQPDEQLALDLVEESLDCLGDVPGVERCLLLSIKAMRLMTLEQRTEAENLAAAAVELADSVEDPTALGGALTARSWTLLGTPNPNELGETMDRALAQPTPLLLGVVPFSDHLLSLLPVPALQRGERAAFETLRARVAEHPSTQRSRHLSAAVCSLDAADALAAGRFEEAQRLTAALPSWPVWAGVRQLHATITSIEHGRRMAVISRLETFLVSTPQHVPSRAILASLHAHAGDRAEAAHHVEILRRQRPFDELGWSAPLVLRLLAETAAHLGDIELAAELLPVLSGYSGQLLASFGGIEIDGAADRAIGQLLLTLGRADEAVERLTAAAALERTFGADALMARTNYWLARARLDRDGEGEGDQLAARQVLQEALVITRAAGMTQLEQDIRALVARRQPGESEAEM